MKSLIARFVEDQSGAMSFEDGLTVFSLTIGFIAALVLLNGTFVQLYAAIFGLLPGPPERGGAPVLAAKPRLRATTHCLEAARD